MADFEPFKNYKLREKELLDRERERERYNRMVQAQNPRDRRRCVASPTRLQCQYIHRGRANILFATSPTSPVNSNNNSGLLYFANNTHTHPSSTVLSPIRPTAPIPFSPNSSLLPSSVSAISPDAEPMFQMSPVGMQCLPPLRNAEPINVMTLRNCTGPPISRSRLRAKSTRAAVPPLLYTFPRPNPNSISNQDPNLNPNPSSNLNSTAHSKKSKGQNQIPQPKFTSIKKPFGLVSQNHDAIQNSQSVEEFCSVLESPPPPPDTSSLFLDLSLTPHPPTFPLFPTEVRKHVRIAADPIPRDRSAVFGNPWNNHAKKKSRAPTPMPSPKLRDAPIEPVLTNVTVSRTRLSSPFSSPSTTPAPLKRILSLPIPIPYHTPRKEDTGLFEDDISVSRDDDDHDGVDGNRKLNGAAARFKANDDNRVGEEHTDAQNCLGLGLPFSPLPLPADTNASPLAHFFIPTGDLSYYSGPVTDTRMRQSISSSIQPEVGLGLVLDEQASSKDDLKPPSRKRRSREIIEAEYFDNLFIEREGDDGTSVDRGELLEAFHVPASQRFESLEPVFPAFSIAQDSVDLSFGRGLDNSHLQLVPDVTPDQIGTTDLDNTKDSESESVKESKNRSSIRPVELESNSNPWLQSESTFSSSSSLVSARTFPRRVPSGDQQPVRRNGKADLNVFHPRPIPCFGDRDNANSGLDSNSSSSGSGSGSGSGSERGRNNITRLGSRSRLKSGSEPSLDSRAQFLSFPIPIFNPHSPFAEATTVTNMLVPLPQTSASEPNRWQLSPGQQKEKEFSYRSSVYGGCRDSMFTVADPPESFVNGSERYGQARWSPRLTLRNSAFRRSESSLTPVSPSKQKGSSHSAEVPCTPSVRILEQAGGSQIFHGQEPAHGERKKEAYGGFLKKIVGLKGGIGMGKP